MKKIYLLFLLFLFAKAYGQVTVTATGGTTGPTPYTTLKAAFDAINLGAHTGQISISLIASTVETATAQLNATGSGGASYTSITIAPTVASVSVSATIAASMITFNGASNVTVNGNNNLTFINTNTGGNTITYINDATKVAIKNTAIKGATTTGTSGVVFFSTGVTTGNDNNTLDGCSIDGMSTALLCLYSVGSTTNTTIENSGDTLRSCNFFDNNQTTGSTYGVYLNSGNTDWSITGNSIYQTVTRNSTIQGLFYGMVVFPTYVSDQHTISGNFIGGNASGATGTMTLSSSAAIALGFIGMDIETGGPLNVIQNNTIRNVTVSYSFTGGSFSNAGIFTFIGGYNGTTSITGNTITNLSYSNSSGSALGSGIVANGRVTAAGTVTPTFTISNNTISNITYNAGGTGNVQFIGIRTEVSSGNSLTSTAISNPTFNVAGNNINTLSAPFSNTLTWIRGLSNISTQGTSSTALLFPKLNVTSNTFSGFSCAGTTASYSNPVCVGIFFSGTGGATDVQTFSQNIISTFTSTNTTDISNVVTGILATNVIGTITRNRIYDLKNKAIGSTNNPGLVGINIRAALGTSQIANNFVSLGTGENTNLQVFGFLNNFSASSAINLYFNSLLITGTGDITNTKTTAAFFRGTETLGAITTTMDLKDNLLINTRTGGSANFAIANVYTTAPTNFTSNYNDLYSSNSATIGLWGASPLDFATWKTTSGQDANSVSKNVTFVNPATGDLHLAAPSNSDASLRGIPAGGITTDYDGDARSASIPYMGADEGQFALPITLTTFNAQRNGTVNDLTWSTAQEINTSLFIIERSTDGRNFTQIGQVAAAGNSSISHNYQFTDVAPAKGINYYRLRILDRDNNAKYSDIRNVRNMGNVDFAIYPNPVKDVMKIDINADRADKGVVIISDVSGKQVYSRQVNVSAGNNTFSIETSNMAQGAYIIKIQLTDDMIVKKCNKM